jgi:hypothetical protein
MFAGIEPNNTKNHQFRPSFAITTYLGVISLANTDRLASILGEMVDIGHLAWYAMGHCVA